MADNLTQNQVKTDGTSSSATYSAIPAVPQQHKSGFFHQMVRLFIIPFTRVHRIPVFKRVWLYMAIMGIYDFIVGWIADQGLSAQLFKEAGNAAYIGAVFGLLLVFRTNSAYERWWEGRRLWGQLVNDSRNLAIKVHTYTKAPAIERILLGEQIVSFAYSLKHHLRDTRPTKDLPGLKPLSKMPANAHLPSQVALTILSTIGSWHQRGLVSETMLLVLDPHARSFMDICGACERIRSSPLAVSYRAFMRQGIALNLLVMPWYVAPQLDYFISLPIVMIGAYFLIGLELIAEDIEDPFGEDGDDLPLDTICANIQKSITEITSSETSVLGAAQLDDDPLKYTMSHKTFRVDPLKGDL